MPDVYVQVVYLATEKMFYLWDNSNRYLQIPLTGVAKLKTAIITHDSVIKFESMPFELLNAP